MRLNTDFDMYSDTPPGKDPDKYSPTLRRYHRALWSKPLPDGSPFELKDDKAGGYLYHCSDLGEFRLSSDAACNTFSSVKRLLPITSQVPANEIATFFSLCSTIGAYIVFPGRMIRGKQTINMARGCHPKIRDRIDLTLECIRRHYAGQSSPLSTTLERYKAFFALFDCFDGYVNFFLLNDLVESNEVKFLLDCEQFDRDGYPKDLQEYRELLDGTMRFVRDRNKRIDMLGLNVSAN